MLLIVWIILVFLLGATIGSFLNVCIYRLPYDKSILWPLGSYCGQCVQPIRWYDNLPLVSYWLLRGRCRICGARFSARYFVIELITALAFVGLFVVEIVFNVHNLEVLKQQNLMLGQAQIWMGLVPFQAILVFFFHAVLLSFLIVASVVDLDHMEIPLGITATGTVCGLVLGTILWT
jgi:leader peptidase (prepilin peptidase)/N-methyltransferase